jgi:hypothetical protein
MRLCFYPAFRGSFIVDELTDLVEGAVYQEFERISERGGVLGASKDTEASIEITDDVTEVTLTLDDGDAAEAGQLPGSFTVTQTNQGRIANTIVVRVAVTGSATSYTDYIHPDMNWTGISNEYLISILGNQLSRTITITPVLDAFDEEGDETVVITLLDTGEIYTVGLQTSATITIRGFQKLIFMDGFEDQL